MDQNQQLVKTNTIRGYDADGIIVEDNLTVDGNLTVMGNIIFTGIVSGIPVGEATQTAVDLKANNSEVVLALAF